MEVYKIPFKHIPQLSSRDKSYTRGNGLFKPFYKYEVTLESFQEVINDKSKDQTDRTLLVKVLQQQYAFLKPTGLVKSNIEKLAENNTFTVTTAHQPSLFTGPLYYIYKIISTINLAEQLNCKYPEYHFVPIFVTGGEDHDFEEVQKVNLFSNSLIWESGETGSVGKMSTKEIATLLPQLKDILGNSQNATTIYNLMARAYTENDNYAKATIQMVHQLFEQFGLVVLNMSHVDLKRKFIPLIREEILEKASHLLVEETTIRLNEIGFKTQANPREINFFYIGPQFRERIVEEDGVYKVLNQDLQFTPQELLEEIKNNSQRFSPNVVMRPLYQELILPNLAYIGGGGELAYWLERKSQFSHFGINYPMLIRRNSVLWLDKTNSGKLKKLNISVQDVFKETESLIKQFVKETSEETLTLEKQKKALSIVFEEVQTIAKSVDPTLNKTVLAEQAKQLKSLEQLESKIIRAEKHKHEIQINQIRNLKEKLFPHNGLQERHDNFMTLYLKYGEIFFSVLKENLNPLDKGFIVIQDNTYK